MGRLDNKVVIITGAGRGMGRAAAILFAKEGAKVIVADRVAKGAEGGKDTVRMIREAAGEAVFIETDVSKAEDVKRMVKTAVDTYGKLDVLYNNAGICFYQLLPESTEENLERHIDVHVKGTWLGMKYAIPEMLKAGGGSVINVASFVAHGPHRGGFAYASSKAAVITLTKVVSNEYADKNIRVNVISPGTIDTPMSRGTYRSAQAEQRMAAVIPQRRLGRPEEIAQVALFLASDESSIVTGSEIIADGGILSDSRTGI